MPRFQVWAPRAQKVELVLRDRRQPMVTRGRGWYECDAEASPGDDYWFSLDGAEPVPDPRSPWQPYGVHGPSRLVDHSAYPWTDSTWKGIPVQSAVVYELHVGTFTAEGTFDAAAEKLDHLVDLGVTAVELMPVNEFPGVRGWGYDGAGLYAPHHSYGGPESLKRFVDACHTRGLAVVLDVVYNHLGPDGNYLGSFGPYFTDHYGTAWGDAVNLDGHGSSEVRRFFIGNAVTWLRDYHFDGLRIDAVHAIVDTSAVHFLEELAEEVEKLKSQTGRNLFLIAESDLNDPRLVTTRDAGGFGLDAQWSDDFHHALHAYLTGEQDGYYADFGSLEDVAAALARVFVYDRRYSRYRGRVHGRPAGDLPRHRFLAYMQNHDQVRNRAAGERSSMLMSEDLLLCGAALVLLSPFTPMLFMGEEWGATTPFQYFTDHRDPELAKAVSEGRRNEFRAFGWNPAEVPDPQDAAMFERCKLDWSEPAREPHSRILRWHKDLIRLRKSEPDLCDSGARATSVVHNEDEGWLVVRRGRITIACNFSSTERGVPLEGAEAILCSAPPRKENGMTTLPPKSVSVFQTK
ncbi:MAG TPA: malto-oligosyltrehalose trehalohydrolase [Actinomycetota bacterium]|nr:malto-oligosyltrehalose trehalohydrolase [Actinomycetota bacterium]